MKRIFQIIAPADPPFTPMAFTRIPIVQRFWYGGLAAAAVGFTLGFGLWMWQHGMLPVEGNYFLLKLMHARIQIEGFVGSFLLGFALQSGPHMTGGKPPASKILLQLLAVFWTGFLLSMTPDMRLALLGNGLSTLAFAWAGYLLLKITLAGSPQLRLARGLPLAAGITLMSITPWLELDDPGYALFVLWCGPVTVALVAAQQLINNVLGGKIIQGKLAILFLASLALSWMATGAAAFTEWESWRLVGLCWLVSLALLTVGTDFGQASRRFGWKSINVTLSLGLAYAFMCALQLILLQIDQFLDMAVHLLGAGVLTTLIIGVTARVAGFFSAGAVLPDRVVSWLVVLWGVVALTRTIAPMTPMEEMWTVWISVLGGLILVLWGVRTGYRLMQIQKLVPPTITINQ